ncbi:hypothetical protein [Desulfonatronum parangueonense]
MAKKQRKDGKKGKKDKHLRFSRAESKLLKYWQEERWDAFVSLFARKQSELTSAEISGRWNDAVFNLLVQTLFVDKAPHMLPALIATLKEGPALSPDVQVCLDLAGLYHKALGARIPREAVLTFPVDLPPPFGLLRGAMLEMLENSEEQAPILPKRTRDPGVKLLKSFIQSYEKLRQANFLPRTVSPFDTWFKHADALINHLINSGADKSVMHDLHALVRAFKVLYNIQRQGETIMDVSLLFMFKRLNIHFIDHPVLINMWRIFLSQGRMFSTQDKERMSLLLGIHIPSMMDGSLRNHPRLLAVQTAIRLALEAGDGDLFHHVFYSTLLRSHVWTSRERYLLMILGMEALEHKVKQTRKLFAFEDDEDVILQVNTNLAAWLREMHEIRLRLGLQGQNRILPYNIWDNLLFSADFEFVNTQIRFLHALSCAFPFPKQNLLCLAAHADAVFYEKKARAFVEKFRDEDAPGIQLSEKECSELLSSFDLTKNFTNLLQAWRPLLEEATWQCLLSTCADKLVQIGMRGEVEMFFFEYSYWEAVEGDLIRYLAEHLAPTSPLYGFFRMVSRLEKEVLPRKKDEAAPFLANFPPDSQALSLVIWFLNWHTRSRYTNTFLLEVLSRVKHEATRAGKWIAVVKTMQDASRTELFSGLLQIWEAEGWIKNPPDQEFIEALRIVKTALHGKPTKKPQKKAGLRRQQRTLF